LSTGIDRFTTPIIAPLALLEDPGTVGPLPSSNLARTRGSTEGHRHLQVGNLTGIGAINGRSDLKSGEMFRLIRPRKSNTDRSL
jgi:hypothetical protein